MENNKPGERNQIKEESKEKADCRSSVERIEAEKQKVEVQQQKKLKKKKEKKEGKKQKGEAKNGL